MKKQLLSAALMLLGVVALSPSVDAKSTMDSTLSLEWMNTDVSTLETNARQAFAKDGKFYLQNKATSKIEVWDGTGKLSEIASGGGTNITTDDAGNIIVRLGTFNTNYVNTRNEMRIISADGTKTVDLPLSGIPANRADFWGHVKGNVLDATTGGMLYMGVTWYPNIVEIPIINGAQDVTNTYTYHYTSPFGISGNITTTTLMSAWNGDEHLSVLSPYITKTNCNSIEQLGLDTDGNWVHKGFYITPRHNGCSGYTLFTMGGQRFIVYSTGSNNADGFSIAKVAVKDSSKFEDTDENYRVGTKYAETGDDGKVTYANNAFYGNHFSAETISDTEAYIYQYFPKGYIAKYKFTYKNSGVKAVKSTPDYKVIGRNGEITVTGANGNIEVYTIGGALISTGAASVNCAPGLYIVKVNGQATKVVVK
ncbi:MAG: hypothetical protein LKF31_11065 [Muribaculaceae bacterium]|jgi:hypothetical protein|nr:hypothetical protein [Muribaculaceae bacterium]